MYTSGKSSSAAGLTASVVKEPETGEFCIEVSVPLSEKACHNFQRQVYDLNGIPPKSSSCLLFDAFSHPIRIARF